MRKLDFSTLKITDIDGNPLETRPIIKNLANMLYCLSRDVSLLEIALTLNKGDIIEVTEEQVKGMKQVIDDERSGLVTFVRKALSDFIS